MKIAVLGSTGMLGHMVVDYLSRHKDWTIYAHARNVNLSKSTHTRWNVIHSRLSFSELREECEYDYVINCVGIIGKINRDADSLNEALYWNGIFPIVLAKNPGLKKIIHISSDGVFSGNAGYRYLENHPHDCGDVYAASKSMGEIQKDNFLTLRCSIVGREIPPNQKSLLEWFLNNPNNTVKGYTNHLWNGITTLQFAKICENIITKNIWFDGVQHVVPLDVITKYGLLDTFNKTFKTNKVIMAFHGERPVNRSLGTISPERNQLLWDNKILSIPTMVQELYEYYENKIV